MGVNPKVSNNANFIQCIHYLIFLEYKPTLYNPSLKAVRIFDLIKAIKTGRTQKISGM